MSINDLSNQRRQSGSHFALYTDGDATAARTVKSTESFGGLGLYSLRSRIFILVLVVLKYNK